MMKKPLKMKKEAIGLTTPQVPYKDFRRNTN
jgi:hypothetical protein